MAYDVNRKDFEDALKELVEYKDDAKDYLTDELVSLIENVVDEYERHYQSDIEDLATKCESLQEQVESLTDNS